jgi:hypothetical protein
MSKFFFLRVLRDDKECRDYACPYWPEVKPASPNQTSSISAQGQNSEYLHLAKTANICTLQEHCKYLHLARKWRIVAPEQNATNICTGPEQMNICTWPEHRIFAPGQNSEYLHLARTWRIFSLARTVNICTLPEQ